LGIFVIAVGVFVAARLWRLTTYSLRPDEIFSLQTARQGWRALLAGAVRDTVHPPLFYLLLKAWIAIGGESELWLRLFPVLTAITAILPFVLWCRELHLRADEMNLALSLMAVNGYLIYYAQELRMYSLLLCLTLTSLWLFARVVRVHDGDRATLAGLFAVNCLLVCTHYYGWLVIGVELVFLLGWARHRLVTFALSVAAVVVCFSPWAYLVMRVVARRGLDLESFARPGFLDDVLGYYGTLSGPLRPAWRTNLGLFLFAFPVLLWAGRMRRTGRASDSRAPTFWLLALVAVVPVLFVYVASHVLPYSVWGPRLLIFTAPAVMALVAAAIYRLRPAWVRAAMVLCLVGWAAVAGFQELNRSGKNAWASLVLQMSRAEDSGIGGIMVYAFGSSDETIAFYLKERHDHRFRTKRVKSVAEMDGDHFWVAARSPSSIHLLVQRGYEVGRGFEDGFGGRLFPVWRP
jgi:4-amino-4-deoxy-L-arabinose transferase-like glycosyltransferase